MDTTSLFPDLVVQFDDITAPTIFPEEKGKVKVVVTNQGDKLVRGPLDINLYASTDSVIDLPLNEGNLAGTDELLGSLNRPRVNLAPGESKSFTLNFADSEVRTPSVVAPGSYYLIAGVDPGNTIAESNEENNLASTHISADGSDVIIDWNATALNSIQATGIFDPLAIRNLAIVHAAIYDAVNAIDRSHSAYLVNVDPSEAAGASPQAAAAAAAHHALVNLYPTQAATFDLQLSRSLAEIPDGPSESKGIALGDYVADQILALRSTDGAADAGSYTPGTEPGEWQPTPPNFAPAVAPQGGQITPFAISNVLDFRPDAPPTLDSDQYAAEFNEVKALGSATSSTRTAEQTEIAKFWSFDRPSTFSVLGDWNKIAEEVALQQGNTLEENARLFALLNIAQADGTIVTLDAKYTYNQWRPVTAIREADTDGNPDTVADPQWTPLLDTPANPDYISGHATTSGAAAVILTSFFGEDFSFTTTSQELPGISRSYGSFFEAADENALSRLYAGIHFRSSAEQGLATGIAVGNYVAQNILA